MAKNFDHVSHIKSRLTRDIENGEFYGLTPTADNSDGQGSSPIKLNLAKRPSAENLIEGEIAVNYLKGHETLTIKNTEDEIVGFVNENEFNQAQEIVASGLAQEKEERISEIASLQERFGNVSDTTDEIQDDIAEMELVVSASLNDLNKRLVDTTELVENGLVELDNKIDEEIENITENIENAFQQLDVNIEDLELIISSSLNDLNTRIIEHNNTTYTKQEVNSLVSDFFDSVAYDSENKVIKFSNGQTVVATLDATSFIKDGMVSNVEVSNGNLVITFNTDAGKEAISIPLTDIFNPNEYYDKETIDGLFDDMELAVAASLNDLNSRIIDMQNSDEEFKNSINNKELVIAASLNDLNDRIVTNDSVIAQLLNEIADLKARVETLENQ